MHYWLTQKTNGHLLRFMVKKWCYILKYSGCIGLGSRGTVRENYIIIL